MEKGRLLNMSFCLTDPFLHFMAVTVSVWTEILMAVSDTTCQSMKL